MDARTRDRLDKVLALADSSHEGEAMVAVRKAQRLLSRDGLKFSDLAQAASSGQARINRPSSFFFGAQPNHETQIVQLHQRLRELLAEVQSQTIQAEYWRRYAKDLKLDLEKRHAESERWRQLAQETVEKLWEIGTAIENNTPRMHPMNSGTSDEWKDKI